MLKIIKICLIDFLAIYKKFFWWLVFKIKLFIIWNIFAFVIAIPFLIFYVYFWWKQWLDFLKWEYWNDYFLNFFMSLIPLVYGLSFYYVYSGFIKYYNNFLNWENKKIKILRNIFNLKNFKNYLILSFLFFIFILSFIVIIVSILYISTNWKDIDSAEKIVSQAFSFASIMSIILIFIYLYFFYRIVFAFAFCFWEDLKAIESIKKSFQKTKWFNKFVSTLIVTIIFFTFYSPFHSIKTNIENEVLNIDNYVKLKKSQKVEEIEEFLALEKKYWNLSNERLSKKYLSNSLLVNYPSNYINILWIIYFILFFGIVPLIYIIIFRNIINK